MLSPPLPAAPPVEYTAANYPDRAENAQPDEHIGQDVTKGGQAFPGAAGGHINF